MAGFDFSAHTVLVTGAASGIGFAIAQAFAAHGARVELVDRQRTALDEATARLGDARVTAHAVDLSRQDEVARLADDLQRRGVTLHTLVNNAGIEYPTPLQDPAPDAGQRWQALLQNNVASMFLLTRALLPVLTDNASIINQSSIWGLSGVAEFSAYVASKHAIVGLTRSLAWELGQRGMRVNAVCPGWVRTEAALRSLRSMAERSGQSEAQVLAGILAQQAIPELLEAGDIAGTFLFLASPYARAITGQSIVVSNGEVMH